MIIYNLSDWNTRPAPPIGRCKDCEFWCNLGTIKGQMCDRADNDYDITEMNENDFCSRFEPRHPDAT